MVKLSPFAAHLSRPTAENVQEDSSDDETVRMATNRVKKDREMKELCIKWVFPLKHDGRQVLRNHWNMLSLMYDAFPDIIVIGNGSHNNITNCEEFDTKNECKPKKQAGKGQHFRLHNDVKNSKRQTTTIIHRIRTTRSLKELKSADGVIKKLQDEKAYIRLHSFSETAVDIAHLGFIHSVNPYHTPADHVKQELLEMLKQDNEEIPNFEIVKVRVSTENARSWKDRVDAYEVQCVQQNASTLAKKFREGQFEQEPVVIPYYYRKSHPKMFLGALNRQRKVIMTQYVIKIDSVTPEMAPFLSNAIDLETIHGMVPSLKKDMGEWRLLVDKSNFDTAMKWLFQNWNTIVESIPQTLLDTSPFPSEPKIASRLGRKSHDPYSSEASEDGTLDSYGTILSAMFEADADDTSFATVETDEQKQSNIRAPVSFAKVVAGGASTTSVASAVTTPIIEVEFRAELEQLRKENEAIKRNAMEEALRARREHEQQISELRSENQNQVEGLREDLKVIRDMLFNMQGIRPRATEAPSKRQAVFDTPTKRKESRPGRQEDHEARLLLLSDPAEKGSDPGEIQEMEE